MTELSAAPSAGGFLVRKRNKVSALNGTGIPAVPLRFRWELGSTGSLVRLRFEMPLCEARPEPDFR